MRQNNIEARDRYYAEVSLKLSKAGFTPQPQEDGYLPVSQVMGAQIIARHRKLISLLYR